MTKEDFDNWKQDEITKAVFRALAEKRLELISAIVYGSDSEMDKKLKGRITQIDDFFEMEYVDE